MKHEALVTVARLRRLALDDASQAVSRALAAEAVAATRADDATRQIADEAAAASSLNGDDAMVEAFAAWLPGARHHAAETREMCERARVPRSPGCAPCSPPAASRPRPWRRC